MDVTKINWKQKLTSRKMWMSVAAFVSAVLVCVGMNDNDIAQITSIIIVFPVFFQDCVPLVPEDVFRMSETIQIGRAHV